MPLVLKPITAVTPDAQNLVEALDAELSQHYDAEQRHGLSLAAIFQPHIRFFIAYLDDVAVGCGGIALFEDFAEVKRMYVRPNARGRGIAQTILAHLETTARASGRNHLRLETGERQPAAMRLYERAGFQPCGAFGDYAAMPALAVAASRFYEKIVK